jgi:undecaprenyl-diphosphatase
MPDWIYAVILGVIEGLTEFIPVSSTGMLLLAKKAMGLPNGFWDTFTVMIQLGAILAVVVLYFGKLWGQVVRLPSDPQARRFALSVIVAFAPAVVLGLALHDFIKRVLFDSPQVQCVSLILGGVVLLVIDRFAPPPRDADPMKLSLGKSLAIGLFQCLAMMPGVSRSGATIVGSMLMGVEKRAAAEFSFFLAIPTMLGAGALDLYKGWNQIDASLALDIAVASLAAFATAIVVVRAFINFLAQHTFVPFGWYRIVAGLAMLAFLLTTSR